MQVPYIFTYSASVIYTSLIRPILEYCDCVWGYCRKVNARPNEHILKLVRNVLKGAAHNILRIILILTRAFTRALHDRATSYIIARCKDWRS